jgi:hypothetical protein
MKNYLLFSLLIVSSIIQAQLLPTSVFSDADSICDYPVSPDPIIDTVMANNFSNAGFLPGDTIPLFKLYDLNGDSMEIETAFNKGKPALLISGSYTCPVFRGKIADINAIVASYSNYIAMGIVYVIEAHPDTDVSPYSGTVWTNTDNYNENILYRQPLTYGERKAIVSDMINNYTAIDMPIVIDGPCNDWWLTFGPAPNMAYLITSEGIVFTKHGWFNQAPYNMSDDIDSLLGSSGIKYNEQDVISSHLSLYNDEKGNISFSLEGNDDIQVIEIFDVMGHFISKQEVNNERIASINLSAISSGIYTFKVYTRYSQIIRGKLFNK